jgi:hypothetical protein
MKNIILFGGTIFGTIALVFGVVALGHHDRTGWLYVILAVICFFLASGLGRRIMRRPDA